MKYYILLCGFSLFSLCLIMHALAWRMWHPRKHALSLLTVFLAPLIPFSVIFLASMPGEHMSDIIAISVLHLALTCAYIQIYPAAQAFSPTLLILLLAKKSMPLGITREELGLPMDTKLLLGARVADLLDADLVKETDGTIDLTARGAAVIDFFIAFRRALGLGLGKG